MKKIIFFAFINIIILSGCYKTTYYTNKQAKNYADVNKKHHIGIYGLVEFSDPEALDQICPHGVASVVSQQSFLDGFVAFITFSFYSPFSVSITCANDKSVYKIYLDKDKKIAYFEKN
jgi:hypothetical protein